MTAVAYCKETSQCLFKNPSWNEGFAHNIWLQVLLLNINTSEIEISAKHIIYTQSMAANALLKKYNTHWWIDGWNYFHEIKRQYRQKRIDATVLVVKHSSLQRENGFLRTDSSWVTTIFRELLFHYVHLLIIAAIIFQHL